MLLTHQNKTLWHCKPQIHLTELFHINIYDKGKGGNVIMFISEICLEKWWGGGEVYGSNKDLAAKYLCWSPIVSISSVLFKSFLFQHITKQEHLHIIKLNHFFFQAVVSAIKR